MEILAILLAAAAAVGWMMWAEKVQDRYEYRRLRTGGWWCGCDYHRWLRYKHWERDEPEGTGGRHRAE